MVRAYAAILLLPLLGGCSTVGSYLWRPTNYTGLVQSDKQLKYTRVATLSMDASRRLLITPVQEGAQTCSEPPPDAIASILADASIKGGIRFTPKSTEDVDARDKFQTTLASIAARSAAVEFWRTTSFAYCQLLLNRWDDKAAAYLAAAQAVAPEMSKGPLAMLAQAAPPPPPPPPEPSPDAKK